ncbi:fumarylacetoacetate hydrolase family protein [Castellaniella defragrans]|uniref:2-keto-4-pentenoate hydratase/2-oxohepta-3-ene-1,7-dioic acid hydratase in catechol pathway n=1 Tax=Castellaniella defragrans TaxID=75697 RepID=A0A7W9TRG5_CASDE|nr:fumarylacetoacetate hydrolase family protein [Castellaniella defragrans]KAB0622270.1 fumarylacetoacetate hydrolase family protein [Castellaniella defragrans]MBB6084197.1 2-keto-4-pentenoate hydratase/2-oxohepta-3-ene-1,7-dioic acid hydratase in catechol pathway [Castellaniella defragrans]
MAIAASGAYALGTFSLAGSPGFPGLVMDGKVLALAGLQPLSRRLGTPLTGIESLLTMLDDWAGNALALSRLADHLAGCWTHGQGLPAEPVDVGRLRVHAPIERPRQFFCSGANYRKHVIDLIVDQRGDPATQGMSADECRAYAVRLMDERAERGAPYIFTKPWSAIAGPYDPIRIPGHVEQPDWELELAVVIGKPCYRVSRDEARDCIAGYTIVNDITNRARVHRQDLKALGTDWVMGKGLPGFSPMGPYLVPASQVPDPQDLRITLKLNGRVMQDESTADMIFTIPRLIEYLSSQVQLWPGDILITGSPAGNGTHFGRYLKPGDVLEGTIGGLGMQRNVCIASEAGMA